MRANLLWYIRLMLALCLFVLLFLCVLYLISDRSSRQLMEETVHQQQTYLARGATMVGDEISAFWGTQVDLLQKTDAINDLATATTLQPAHYADMIKAQNALTNILGKRNDSHPFLLVLDQGDGIALSPSAIYHNMRESVENGVLSLNGLGYEAVLEFLRENANFGASLANVQVLAYKSSADGLLRENSYLSIIRKLNASSTQCDTYAIWMLGLEDLCDTLSGESDIAPFFALQKGEALLYSTDEGAPLSQIHGGVFHDSANELTYLCVEIPFVRLTAYLALNNRVVLAHLASYALLWNTLFAAFIALCAALAVMLFFYLIHPLNRLYKRVCASGSALPAAKNRQGSIFTQIESHIAEMGCDYTRLNRQLVQYRAFLHQSLLSKLLLGIRAAPSEVEALHTQLQPLDRQPFCVAIVSALWGGAPRDNRFEEALGPCLNALFAGAPCIWLDQGSAAVILECDTPSTSLAAQMEALHCALCQALASEEGACIGVGRSRTGIRNIRDSFLEARRALCEAQLKKRASIVFFDTMPDDYPQYGVAYSAIEKLQNLLESGDAEGACRHLDEMAAPYLRANARAFREETAGRQLYYEVLGVVLRIASRHGEASIFSSFPQREEMFGLADWLEPAHSSFRYIAEITCGNQESGDPLASALVEYIMRYYADSAMSLSTMAEAFAMSERSLSRYFKERMDDTFSALLEKKRLSEAENLLRQGKHTMKEVAALVGYANTTTFLKAFKRRHGITPSEWLAQAKFGENGAAPSATRETGEWKAQ